jgi:hypothetical protein
MTPRATVTVTGCAGAIPVLPNPGVAVTAAIGGAVVTVDGAPATGGPAFGLGPAVVGVGVRELSDDSDPVPHPATTVSTAATAKARQRIR